jgi:cytochrome bd-type quinol oxidase subunit 2
MLCSKYTPAIAAVLYMVLLVVIYTSMGLMLVDDIANPGRAYERIEIMNYYVFPAVMFVLVLLALLFSRMCSDELSYSGWMVLFVLTLYCLAEHVVGLFEVGGSNVPSDAQEK